MDLMNRVLYLGLPHIIFGVFVVYFMSRNKFKRSAFSFPVLDVQQLLEREDGVDEAHVGVFLRAMEDRKFGIWAPSVGLTLVGTLFPIAFWPSSNIYFYHNVIVCLGYCVSFLMWRGGVFSRYQAAWGIAVSHTFLMIGGAFLAGPFATKFLLDFYGFPAVLVFYSLLSNTNLAFIFFGVIFLAVIVFENVYVLPEPLFCVQCMEQSTKYS
jgi:hypothetical protein